MKIGIYNRYWGTMGGGEKHVGTIAEVLSREHDVDLIRVSPLDVDAFRSRMGLGLERVNWVDWPGDSCAELAPRSACYDLFINSTYCSSMISQAKRSVYLVFFPHHLGELSLPARALGRISRNLRSARQDMLAGWLDRTRRLFRLIPPGKARQFLDSYDLLLANSEFTGGWIRERWGRRADVLPPPIDVGRYRSSDLEEKRKVVLSVGRFFAGDHNKKHLEMISAFRRICDRGLLPEGWEYHLAGSVHSERGDHLRYFEKVNELAQGYPIRILGNLGSAELLGEYAAASIFWHGSGWGEDEFAEPEKMEHFGMTTCEAMAAGVVPIVMPLGGQRETVENGVNGFYFRTEEELVGRTVALMKMHKGAEMDRLRGRAVESVQKYAPEIFGREIMRKIEPIFQSIRVSEGGA
ncbi:glycosyltransferase family 4 protein [Luteimonas sp. FCS-9]|uniref:glycosyltransferase family 4 protein n=1 Tax=Luteimonas sp. FCS-9 TaxID=1547516 RepID=UPI0009E1ADB7|nr:glycosyltransferase family 4 protein [Luteimonas sp. FCS-9]